MDYTPKRRRVATKQEVNPLFEAYPHDLQMYKIPPSGEISLVEFQDWAMERQKSMSKMTTINHYHNYKNNFDSNIMHYQHF